MRGSWAAQMSAIFWPYLALLVIVRSGKVIRAEPVTRRMGPIRAVR